MKHSNKFVLESLLCVAIATVGVVVAVGQTKDSSQKQQKNTPAPAAQTASPTRGAKVFEQNCARCHNPPQGFPPSLSGTIAMHMRVRANLSDDDYKALRHFLNP